MNILRISTKFTFNWLIGFAELDWNAKLYGWDNKKNWSKMIIIDPTVSVNHLKIC